MTTGKYQTPASKIVSPGVLYPPTKNRNRRREKTSRKKEIKAIKLECDDVCQPLGSNLRRSSLALTLWYLSNYGGAKVHEKKLPFPPNWWMRQMRCNTRFAPRVGTCGAIWRILQVRISSRSKRCESLQTCLSKWGNIAQWIWKDELLKSRELPLIKKPNTIRPERGIRYAKLCKLTSIYLREYSKRSCNEIFKWDGSHKCGNFNL